MTIRKFDKVSITEQRTFVCPCGRRFKRSKKFSQTVNPFNVDASGDVKTASVILTELNAEVAAWRRAECPNCGLEVACV